jgi:hypothetical protein
VGIDNEDDDDEEENEWVCQLKTSVLI